MFIKFVDIDWLIFVQFLPFCALWELITCAFNTTFWAYQKVVLKKLCCFYKIKNNGIPSYLAELIPSEFHLCNTWNTRNIATCSCRTDAFKSSFFPWAINEWSKRIRASSFNIFRANLIKIIRPIPNSVFGIFNPLGLKLITWLHLGLSHLNEHRFKHNFNDYKSSMHMQPGHWVNSSLFSPLQLL